VVTDALARYGRPTPNGSEPSPSSYTPLVARALIAALGGQLAAGQGEG
jgi:hypothetical protein